MSERPKLDLGNNQSLSHSRRTTFRRCRRLYYYQYVMGLELKQTPAPLRMGAIYSDGLEAEDPEVVKRAYSELVAEAMHDSQYHFADQLLDELAVVEPMVETYLATVALPAIDREVPFIGYASGGYQDNGFFDGVGTGLGNDRILLVENKLKGRFGVAEEKALATDEQLLGYILNLTRMHDVGPEKVDVRYEVAKKPGLRRGKAETADAFRTRVSNDIRTNPTKYHVVIEGDQVRRSWQQLDQWVSEFDRMASDLDREFKFDFTQEQEAFPMNRDACYQYGACPMLGICGARSTDEAALYIEKNFDVKESNGS